MTKQIREYMEYITAYLKGEHTNEELIHERSLLLKRIELYQHERLIHLLVTLAFAAFFLIALFMFLSIGGAGLFVLTLLFLILLIPYIKHYYFLENTVQEMYRLYYKIEKL